MSQIMSYERPETGYGLVLCTVRDKTRHLDQPGSGLERAKWCLGDEKLSFPGTSLKNTVVETYYGIFGPRGYTV